MKESALTSKSTMKRTVVLLVCSLLLLFFSVLAHIAQNMMPFFIAVLCILMVGGMIVAFALWDKIPALRRFVRVAILSIAGLVLVFGILLAVVYRIENPASTAGYLLAAYGTLVLQVLQGFTAFMLPVLVAASKWDYRFDNAMLFGGGILNALAVTVFMLFAVPEGYMPYEYEIPRVMNAYALAAWVVAAVMMVPLLTQMFKRPSKKANEEA